MPQTITKKAIALTGESHLTPQVGESDQGRWNSAAMNGDQYFPSLFTNGGT